MDVNELGLNGLAEYDAFADVVRRRIATQRVAESGQYHELRGWRDERATPPDVDALGWPQPEN